MEETQSPTTDQLAALKKLRTPFDKSLISKLPKPTRAQTDEVKKNFKAGIRCDVCGGWHHPKVVHLDYVGHAALTSRLLDVDPLWNWEPFAVDDNGSPKLDNDGGMWIKLTVCGLTRLGYGDAEGKSGASATKERIGDALRNAAMRFGAALDLWSKADLSATGDDQDAEKPQDKKQPERQQSENQSKDEDRTNLEKWKTYVDGFTHSTLDVFVQSCEAYINPAIIKLSEAHGKELTVAKNEMTTYLKEKEEKKA